MYTFKLPKSKRCQEIKNNPSIDEEISEIYNNLRLEIKNAIRDFEKYIQ